MNAYTNLLLIKERQNSMDYKSSRKNDEYFWRENFEEFKKEDVKKYDEGIMNYNFNTNLYDKLIINLLDPILDTIPHSGEILDAGGGTGKWSIYFAQKGFHVQLIDISKPMLDFASDRIKNLQLNNNVTIIHGSICSLPFEDQSFDFIFSERNPISHCGKRKAAYKAIMELYRVLKPTGFLWACVLNKIRKVAQLIMELDFKRAQELLKSGTMIRSHNEYTYYFLENELKELLANTGFHDIQIYPTTAMAELIPSAWLLGNEPLEQLLKIEQMVHCMPEARNFGVRLHAIAQK